MKNCINCGAVCESLDEIMGRPNSYICKRCSGEIICSQEAINELFDYDLQKLRIKYPEFVINRKKEVENEDN